MAVVTVRDEQRRIEDVEEIRAFLKPHGIWYEKWNVGDRVNPDADSAEILAAYAPEIERLKAQGGYVTSDVINVTAATPNLDAMLAKFSKEHTHSEDEVRFIVKGNGVFHVNPKNNDPVFAINVEAGDLINVPAGTQHWFDLCQDRCIRAIRLFLDPTGWTPEYMTDSAHVRFEPLCMGPQYIGGQGVTNSAVKL